MDQKKNVLILGGSYFTGRVFLMTADKTEYQFTVINRGRFSVRHLGDITEYACDRHDTGKLKMLPAEAQYDAVIDFCAYEPGDIETIMKYLPCAYSRYIYISTADVCAPSAEVRNEGSPLLTEEKDDPVSRYTYHKMLLEQELKQAAKKKKCSYTILRPAFIYGPFNYAPRESWYIKKIVEKQPVPHPADAVSKFQMVYVKDVARALLLCLENPKAENKTYILSAPEIMTYDRFLSCLKEACGQDFPIQKMTAEEILEQRIPLPFPLFEWENALFDGHKIEEELGFSYGDQKTYMKQTWKAFSHVFADPEK